MLKSFVCPGHRGAPFAPTRQLVTEPWSALTMALPTVAPERQLLHRRAISIEVHARCDGLFDADARITDTRPRDTVLGSGVRCAGEPIHDMLLRVVVDEQLNIVDAGAQTYSMPYPGHCDDHGDIYRRLIGLNLLRGFRAEVKARLGGVVACTHITELTQTLPTAVVQALAGSVIDTRGTAEGAEQPFQIDRCHALRADGPMARLHFPRWYRAPAAGQGDGSTAQASGTAAPQPLPLREKSPA